MYIKIGHISVEDAMAETVPEDSRVKPGFPGTGLLPVGLPRLLAPLPPLEVLELGDSAGEFN